MDVRHLGVTERCVYLKLVLLVKDNSGQQLVPGSGGEEDHRRAPDSDGARTHMRADSSLKTCRSWSGDKECVTAREKPAEQITENKKNVKVIQQITNCYIMA